MKTIFKIILVTFIMTSTFSCEEDLIIFDADNGQTALSFSSSSVNVGICNPTYDFVVESTTKSNVDRTISIMVDASSTASAAEYSVPATITIPAGSFVGTGTVNVDFNQIPEGASRSLVLSFVTPDNSVINTRDTVSISYASACLENSVSVNFTFDDFAEETAYQIYDADTDEFVAGNTAFGEFDGQSSFSTELCLPDGNYTLLILDSYGDGFCCSYGNGDASLSLVTCDGSTPIIETIPAFGDRIEIPFTLGN